MNKRTMNSWGLVLASAMALTSLITESYLLALAAATSALVWIGFVLMDRS